MLTIRISSTIALFLLVAACVTINVYFPAAAAEKAADRIIDQVWGQEKDKKPDSTPPTDEKVKQDKQSLNWLDRLIPAVHAADPDITISTPAIRALQAKMAERHKKLEPYFNSGAVGLTNDALITLRDAASVPLKDRHDVSQLVTEENRDRLALYREIAIANNHPEWEADIRRIFAKRWIERAKKGWWYQDEDGKWQRK